MRFRRATWMFLLVALPLGSITLPGQAQTAADPAAVEVAQDAAADVAVVSPAGAQDAPDPAAPPAVDLRGLTLQEKRDELVLTVKVADLKAGQEAAGQDGVVVDTFFTHEGREFRLRIIYTLPGTFGFTGVALSFRDGEGAPWNELWWRQGSVAVDAAQETFTVAVPRSDLADAKGAAPFPGRFLTGFSVAARNGLGGSIGLGVARADTPQFVDRMPDTGPAPLAYAIQLGLQQTGDARLSSTEPFRASNGEATTFIYTVKAENVGDEAQRFQLRATKVPAGWSVVVPVPVLDLEGGASRDIPVAARIPFQHAHGSAAGFVLEMVGATDPSSVGRVELGVRFLAIPQPAGHHNQLFLHSRPYNEFSQAIGTVFTGNDGYPFMNTMADYEGDAKLALSPQGSWLDMNDAGEPVNVYSWCAPLDPGLAMGLDFQPGQKGHVAVNVQAQAPLRGAKLSAQLIVAADESRWACYGGEGARVLATLNETQAVDLGPTDTRVLEGDLDVWGSADRVPYAKGQNLLLLVQVEAVSVPEFFVAQGQPRLAPGSSLQLPLLDYHDDISQVLTTASGPGLIPLGPQELAAPPGASVAFRLSVANEGDAARSVSFNVTGLNAHWAEVPDVVEVAAHDTASIDFVVRVPAEARDGEMADLLLQAVDAADAASRGLVRLVVNVDAAAVVDESGVVGREAGSQRSSPGPGIALLVAVAGVALAFRRRT